MREDAINGSIRNFLLNLNNPTARISKIKSTTIQICPSSTPILNPRRAGSKRSLGKPISDKYPPKPNPCTSPKRQVRRKDKLFELVRPTNQK